MRTQVRTRECATEPAQPAAAPECFEGVNWPALAERAGEPLDLDGWRCWAAERFADPAPGEGDA